MQEKRQHFVGLELRPDEYRGDNSLSIGTSFLLAKKMTFQIFEKNVFKVLFFFPTFFFYNKYKIEYNTQVRME